MCAFLILSLPFLIGGGFILCFSLVSHSVVSLLYFLLLADLLQGKGSSFFLDNLCITLILLSAHMIAEEPKPLNLV